VPYDVARVQGAYFLATGIWPLISRRSFEAVTGPKTDFWLAQTVGVLVAAIGGVLLLADCRKRVTPELRVLGVASAGGLGLVDTVFSLRGRISKVYLADALVECALVAGWAAERRNNGSSA
jgi:hypothetical protein